MQENAATQRSNDPLRANLADEAQRPRVPALRSLMMSLCDASRFHPRTLAAVNSQALVGAPHHARSSSPIPAMSRHPSDFDDEIVDEASHSSVRTVNGDGRAVVHSAYAAPNVGSRRAQQQAAQREPLLAADSLAGTQSIRHAQRQAAAAFPPAPLPGSNASLAPSSAASVFHSGVAGSSGLSASPVTLGDGGGGSDPSEFEVSYDIDNSNYALNQRHRQHLSLDAAEASVGGPDLATAMQGTEDADARYVPEDEDEHDFGSGIASSSDYARFAAAGLAGSDSSIAFSPVSDPHGIGSGGGSNGLIGSSSVASFEFMVTPQRFWVLFVFCFLSFNQAQFWLTYSPITKKAEAYYGISESDCDLLLNWGQRDRAHARRVCYGRCCESACAWVVAAELRRCVCSPRVFTAFCSLRLSVLFVCSVPVRSQARSSTCLS